MTHNDPDVHTHTTPTEPHRTTYVSRGGGGAMPWVLAAIVAVVAIIAVAFLMTGRTDPSQSEVAEAMDASRAAGYLEGAGDATTAGAVAAAGAAQDAAGRTADQAAAAAADAREAAERAATSAEDAATDASDRVEGDVTISTPGY